MKRHHVLLSVALIVVAILAGCSNQSMYPKFPVAALIRQTGDIVKGQAFDASKFEVVVNYLDNTTQTISGAGIQYTDTNSNGMTADDTLKVNVGNDYYGKPVENTISPTVLDVVSIEAQAKNESYPMTYTKTEGFAVKAYYSETGFITLTPSDGYTVSISYADSVDQDSDEFKTATLVDGVATITFDNLSDTVAVKVSKPAGVIGTGEIKSINQLSDNQTFAFAALEYDEISADEIAESIKMVVTLDNGTTEGLVGQYATVASLGDAVTYKLVDSKTGSDFSTDWNSIDFVDYATSGAADSGIAFQVSFNNGTEDKVEQYVIPVAKTSIELQYKGTGFVAETPYTNIELNAADFRAYLLVGETGSQIRTQLSLTADMLSLPKTEAPNDVVPGVGEDAVTVTVTYMGLDSTTTADSIAAPATVESVAFTVADTYTAPAAQYYNADGIKTLVITADDIELTSVTMTDEDADTSKFTADDFEWVLYTANSAGSEVALDPTTKELDLHEATELYVVPVYQGTPIIPLTAVTVDLGTAVATEIETVVEAGKMVGGNVEVTYNTLNKNGYVAKDVTTGLGYLNTDGTKLDDEPALKVAKAEQTYTVYLADNVSVEKKVIVPAGNGYVTITNEGAILVRNTTEISEKSGATINKALIEKYYTINTNAYRIEEGKAAVAAPVIASINLPASQKLATGDNEIPVVISFVGDDGETDTVSFTAKITGTAYFNSANPTFTITYAEDGTEENAVAIDELIAREDYTIDYFFAVGESGVGQPKARIVDVLRSDADRSLYEEGSFNALPGYEGIDFVIEFTDRNLNVRTTTVTLDIVAASAEEA